MSNQENEEVVVDSNVEDQTQQKDKRPPLSKTEKEKRIKDKMARNKKRENSERKHTGIVTAVQSGDSIKVLASESLYSTSGEPDTIILNLAGVRAPSLERVYYEEGKKTRSNDEEFAWSSREFLRERLIGQPVIYQLVYQIYKGDKSSPAKYLAEVWLYENNELVSIRDETVANGWVEVNRRPELEDKDYENPAIREYKNLLNLESRARDLGLGIHCTSKAKAQASIRHVHKHNFSNKDNKSAFELFEKIKEIPQHGVVEYVSSGSSLRIILLDRMDEITVQLAGVQSPQTKQPFGYEAMWFTSHHLLNRDVIVHLELMDSGNRFYATVKLKEDPDFDITIELLQNGLAKLVDWSISKNAYIADLQAAQESAKEDGLRVWENHTEKDNSRSRSQLSAKVVEVSNSGTIKILPKNAAEPIVIRMSSLKPLYPYVPDNLEGKDKEYIAEVEKDAAFSSQAKDFTRKMLIGKKVTCIEDYQFRGNKFYSVFLKELNVSLRILEEGWGRISAHKADSDRSPQYQQMVLAYNRAAKSGRGVHGSINNAQTSFNDLTREDPKKTQMFLGFFQRAGRVSAVVESVIGATVFIVRIPSENNCTIRLFQEGVYSARVTRNKENPKETPDTPGNRGLALSRRNMYQRDIEIIVGTCDSRGAFYGRVYLNNKDYALTLLEQGYAAVDRNTALSMDEYDRYKSAESIAKKKGANMWEGFDPEEENRKKEKKIQERKAERETSAKQFKLLVTEILDGSHFWYQNVDDIDALNEMMVQVEAENLESASPITPKQNDFVFAKFSGDGNFYRTTVTRVTEIAGEETIYTVLFVDYGNVQNTKSSDLRSLDNSKFGQKVLRPQAQEGRLAFVKTPRLHQEFGIEAASFFKELVYEKHSLIATGVSRDKNGAVVLNIGDEESRVYVNAALVAAGLAQAEKIRERRGRDNKPQKKNQNKIPTLQQRLVDLEQEVKDAHLNIWKHGEPPDSEEEREEEKRKKGLL